MSGHAFFIAWAYGVAFAALAIEVLVLLRRKRKSEAKT
jgi:heme exporter protein CcmD